ncbi:MAG: FHA domain-containing protein [Myxococcales bacterium]|nr:FHA domain-containing protein [Myxococcales bacterium]
MEEAERDRPRPSRASMPVAQTDGPRKSRASMPAVQQADRPRPSRASMPAAQIDGPRKSRASMPAVQPKPRQPLYALEDEADEKTMVGASMDDGATQAFSTLKLKVIEGPDVGRQLPIATTGMVLGRGDGCDFQLMDAAASRRHAELSWTPRGLVLRDLGSGNGTQVNGERIFSDLVIQDGDRISIGLTVIEIFDSIKSMAAAMPPSRALAPRRGAPPAQDPEEEGDIVDQQLAVRRASNSKKTPVQLLVERLGKTTMRQRLIALGVIVFLFAVVQLKSFLEVRAENQRQAELLRLENEAKALEQKYELAKANGRKALRDRRPTDALQSFQEALEIFPDRLKELSREMQVAEQDEKAEVHFKKFKVLQSEEKFEEALAELNEIDERSAFADLIPKLKLELEKQLIEAQKKEIRRLLDERSIEEARMKISALPAVERAHFLDLLDETARLAKVEAASSAQRARQQEAERRRQANQRQISEVTQAIAPIVAKIDRADFRGAQADLDKFNTKGKPQHVVSKIKQLRRLLPGFQKDYSLGNSQYLGKNYERAAEPLARAWTAWRQMGIDGKLGDKIHAQAAEALENKGRSAMQRKDYVEAGKAFKETIKFNKNSKVASNGLNEIIRKADDIYLQGYTEMKSNPSRARQMFEQVISMTPSDSEVNRKARDRKKDLERGL